jgi:triosephosphate isomerase (TIM)
MSLPELIVAGNWKMNGIAADLAEIEAVRTGIPASCKAGVWIFPPATLIGAAAALKGGTHVLTGAQDCHAKDSGAFTGDLSAPILKDAGAAAIIVGHSERRSGHGETSREVKAKASAVLKAGLPVIICLGETKGERESGLAASVCTRQLADSLPAESTPENTVIAYEPVWAIGTGLQATTDDITAIHAVLRAELGKRPATGTQRWRILYGGSVSPANAAGIFESREVDGALVGGASLKAASFLAIVTAGAEALERRNS